MGHQDIAAKAVKAILLDMSTRGILLGGLVVIDWDDLREVWKEIISAEIINDPVWQLEEEVRLLQKELRKQRSELAAAEWKLSHL